LSAKPRSNEGSSQPCISENRARRAEREGSAEEAEEDARDSIERRYLTALADEQLDDVLSEQYWREARATSTKSLEGRVRSKVESGHA
jgi:hypothetical protein